MRLPSIRQTGRYEAVFPVSMTGLRCGLDDAGISTDKVSVFPVSMTGLRCGITERIVPEAAAESSRSP